MDDLRVLIVANDPLVRERLAALLSAQPGFVLVGQIATNRNLTEQIELYHPDVVLWDFGLNPELSIKLLNELPNVSR
jgi:DNA-binding NarL/FixJ family response regulator